MAAARSERRNGEASVRIGVIFPQLEIGTDPGVIREYAQTAEGLGYQHLLIYDHVLGADVTNRPGWTRYTHHDQFHEPFVLFGFLAAVAPSLELVTDVIILPQRQTALVAKQAAEVDVLTGGKLRLGVGSGWNKVEYEALNEDFGNRGRRLDEQIAVLRALWTEPVVTFEGAYHRITEAGLNPLPVQRPIPIWLGGGTDERVLSRIGRLGDGWLPLARPDDALAAAIARIREHAVAAGRAPAAIGIEGRLSLKDLAEAEWDAELQRWRDLEATHLGFNTMGAGIASPRGHIDAIRRFATTVGLPAD
jgi:probable F420-dependent oxidoreductase